MMEEIEKGHLGVSLEDFLKEQGMYENATKYAAESRIKNPAHPGAIIKDSLEELGLSVAEGAKALGVSRSQLHKVVSETSAVTPEMAMRLEIVIGSKAEMWLRLQNSYDLAQAREKVSGLGLKKVSIEHPHL